MGLESKLTWDQHWAIRISARKWVRPMSSCKQNILLGLAGSLSLFCFRINYYVNLLMDTIFWAFKRRRRDRVIWRPCKVPSNSRTIVRVFLLYINLHTHTHTHTYIYILIGYIFSIVRLRLSVEVFKIITLIV